MFPRQRPFLPKGMCSILSYSLLSYSILVSSTLFHFFKKQVSPSHGFHDPRYDLYDLWAWCFAE